MRLPGAILLAVTLLVASSVHGSDSDLKADQDKLQGKWKATITTERGTSNWTLEIKANRTKVTIETTDGTQIFKGESDYKLEQLGKFRAYTYSNLEIQSGENAGKKILTDGESRSSIYKFEDDNFITASSFGEGEKGEAQLIKWKRTTE